VDIKRERKKVNIIKRIDFCKETNEQRVSIEEKEKKKKKKKKIKRRISPLPQK